MTLYAKRIRPHVSQELGIAACKETQGDPSSAFQHLERAHILGQASTVEHVRVHVRMLTWALRRRDLSELAGQLLRIVGAATKTAFGLVPHGNTGGANVSPFKPMPIPPDLAEIIAAAHVPTNGMS